MSAVPRILVTGATGFVGRALVARLARDGLALRASARRCPETWLAGVEPPCLVDLGPQVDWGPALQGVGSVVHCAARVHVMNETAIDPPREFRRINVDGTLALARQAAAHGVRRFVFVSTIGVNGRRTTGRPFTSDDTPAPRSPYAVSKLEAEVALSALGRETGMEIVVVRPPMVYGAGAPGNFGALVRILQRGLPLPFRTVANRRSLVALDNLVDFLVLALRHPDAANRVLLVADGEDLSTPELLRRLGQAMGQPARLLPFPTGALRAALLACGQRDAAQSLLDSLRIDTTVSRRLLDWTPPLSVTEALRRAMTEAVSPPGPLSPARAGTEH